MNEPKRFNPKEQKIEWIAIKYLAVVWESAQRTFDPHWAKRLADEFDPEKFEPVAVMQPNGNGIYHICDGRHRTTAARILWGDDEMVPCILAKSSDQSRAAELFLDKNTNTKNVTKVSKFSVAVTAKRKTEVEINKIVRHCGYRVEASHAHDTIAAVDALHYVYGKGRQTLDRTLRTLREIWGGDPAATCAPLLKGFGAFLCEFSEHLDLAKFIDAMKKRGSPGQLLNDIRGHKEMMHSTTVEAAVTLLLATYNKGRRPDAKLKRKKSD